MYCTADDRTTGIKHKPIVTGEDVNTQRAGAGSSGNDWRCK